MQLDENLNKQILQFDPAPRHQHGEKVKVFFYVCVVFVPSISRYQARIYLIHFVSCFVVRAQTKTKALPDYFL
jgi:hypothetical protein